MLRNEQQVALNDILAALHQAADVYADDAEATATSALRELFQDLGRRRAAWIPPLSEELRRLGDLPSEPDADRETLHRLGNRLKAALSGEDRAAFLEERGAAEAHLAELAESALARELPDKARDLLTRIRDDAAAASRALRGLSPD